MVNNWVKGGRKWLPVKLKSLELEAKIYSLLKATDAKFRRWKNPQKKRDYENNFRKKHPEKLRARSAKFHARHRERRNAAAKAWRRNNLEAVRARKKQWAKANRDKDAAKCGRRRASRLGATPPWSDRNNDKPFYELARQVTLARGQQYQVDHIMPLRAHDRCGLHVPWNLQIISATENASKHNKINYPARPIPILGARYDALERPQLAKAKAGELRLVAQALERATSLMRAWS